MSKLIEILPNVYGVKVPSDESLEFDVYDFDTDVTTRCIGLSKLYTLYAQNRITHFKQLKQEPKPIY